MLKCKTIKDVLEKKDFKVSEVSVIKTSAVESVGLQLARWDLGKDGLVYSVANVIEEIPDIYFFKNYDDALSYMLNKDFIDDTKKDYVYINEVIKEEILIRKDNSKLLKDVLGSKDYDRFMKTIEIGNEEVSAINTYRVKLYFFDTDDILALNVISNTKENAIDIAINHFKDECIVLFVEPVKDTDFKVISSTKIDMLRCKILDEHFKKGSKIKELVEVAEYIHRLNIYEYTIDGYGSRYAVQLRNELYFFFSRKELDAFILDNFDF